MTGCGGDGGGSGPGAGGCGTIVGFDLCTAVFFATTRGALTSGVGFKVLLNLVEHVRHP